MTMLKCAVVYLDAFTRQCGAGVKEEDMINGRHVIP